MPITQEKKTILAIETDLHRHVEGSIHLEKIFGLAKKFGVGFSETTENFFRKLVQESQEQNIDNFIVKLSTRPMRLLITRIMLYKDPSKAKELVRDCIVDFYNIMRLNAQDLEKIKTLNILFSPLNLSINGDLGKWATIKRLDPTQPNQRLTEEEKRDYTLWAKKSAIEKAQLGITWKEYAQTVGNWRREQKESGMDIFITISFRRDVDFQLLTNPNFFIPLVQELQTLFINGDIDLVDLCGPEIDIEQFMPFIRELDKHYIRHTFHAAEVPYSKRTTGYNTMEVPIHGSINHNDKNDDFLMQVRQTEEPYFASELYAHAVRSADLTQRGKKVMKKIIRHKIGLLLNATSNVETGLTKNVSKHHLLSFLLNTSSSELLEELLIAVCTDDPVIRSVNPVNSLGNEFDEIETTIRNKRRLRINASIMTPTAFFELLDKKINELVHQLKRNIDRFRVLAKNHKDRTAEMIMLPRHHSINRASV